MPGAQPMIGLPVSGNGSHRLALPPSFILQRPPSLATVGTADWQRSLQPRSPLMVGAAPPIIVEQRAEQKRMADYYVRAKKEQEDRQNAEAREHFIAQQQTISRATKT